MPFVRVKNAPHGSLPAINLSSSKNSPATARLMNMFVRMNGPVVADIVR